jgi:hypothetical protein
LRKGIYPNVIPWHLTRDRTPEKSQEVNLI